MGQNGERKINPDYYQLENSITTLDDIPVKKQLNVNKILVCANSTTEINLKTGVTPAEDVFEDFIWKAKRHTDGLKVISRNGNMAL